MRKPNITDHTLCTGLFNEVFRLAEKYKENRFKNLAKKCSKRWSDKGHISNAQLIKLINAHNSLKRRL